MNKEETADDNTNTGGIELADYPDNVSVKHQAPPPHFPTPYRYSLYYTLWVQHPRHLTPMRCAEQTIAQLHQYFEDVVLENSLSALVVEGLASEPGRSLRHAARLREVGLMARYSYFFVSPDDGLNKLWQDSPREERSPVVLKTALNAAFEERFIVIADARFSALLASMHKRDESREDEDNSMIWTFDQDIVYSALEYLMARIKVEYPSQAASFLHAVNRSMPKTTSLQLTSSVTTKLASLLQAQAEREAAVNRIATAIRSSLELPSVLQTTVNEVGRALGAMHSALSVEGEHGQSSLTTCYFREAGAGEEQQTELLSDLEAVGARLRGRMKTFVQDGSSVAGESDQRPVAAVPVIYRERMMGVLMVTSDDTRHVWQDNELLLMRTVADQVAVAVNHARLFQQVQHQALTDGLTGCFNRRFFEIQLERDLHLATRLRQPVSLIMLDIDYFKSVIDMHGHDAGDVALRMISQAIREELRGVDTAARYGGEEFAVILPQASLDAGLYVAERLRARIEQAEVLNVGCITTSLGVATFPNHASSPDLLVTTAGRALYYAKLTGRNRVCAPSDIPGE